jgi:hypothetical protein
MNVSKRTLIAALGLAPLGIGAEAFAAGSADSEHRVPMLGFGHDKEWPERRDHFASALEKLAAEIRADRVVPRALQVTTNLEHDAWERHRLMLDFEVTGEQT